jgi:preprotein translocase subunit SecG
MMEKGKHSFLKRLLITLLLSICFILILSIFYRQGKRHGLSSVYENEIATASEILAGRLI